jgi:hypothetical protein
MLDVITIRQSVVAENVAVVPKFLDEGAGYAHDNVISKVTEKYEYGTPLILNFSCCWERAEIPTE